VLRDAEVTGQQKGSAVAQLVEAGKSWVFISANLKRPAKSAQDRLAYLGRQAIKAEFDTGPAEKAKGK
jgi:hypothetical protein